jgi:hypothetical protein
MCATLAALYPQIASTNGRRVPWGYEPEISSAADHSMESLKSRTGDIQLGKMAVN